MSPKTCSEICPEACMRAGELAMQGHELLLSIAPRWEPHNLAPVYYGNPPRPALNSLPSDALWALRQMHLAEPSPPRPDEGHAEAGLGANPEATWEATPELAEAMLEAPPGALWLQEGALPDAMEAAATSPHKADQGLGSQAEEPEARAASSQHASQPHSAAPDSDPIDFTTVEDYMPKDSWQDQSGNPVGQPGHQEASAQDEGQYAASWDPAHAGSQPEQRQQQHTGDEDVEPEEAVKQLHRAAMPAQTGGPLKMTDNLMGTSLPLLSQTGCQVS